MRGEGTGLIGGAGNFGGLQGSFARERGLLSVRRSRMDGPYALSVGRGEWFREYLNFARLKMHEGQ